MSVPRSEPPLERACAACEREHGLLLFGHVNKSHGLCKRHAVGTLSQSGLPWAEIEDLVARIEETGEGWPPDLGEISVPPGNGTGVVVGEGAGVQKVSVTPAPFSRL